MPQQQINLNDIRPPQMPPGAVRLIIIGIVVLYGVFTSWFTIAAEEVGVILRFGKYVRTVQPGLNFKLPFGVEKVYKVAVEKQQNEEFGFRTEKAGTRTLYSSKNFTGESLMLTGDLNAAEVEWVVQYRISDPYNYLFRVRNANQTFRDMNEAVMRAVVGDRTINEVLTEGRLEIESTAERMLQEMCDQYEVGLKIIQVVLQDVNPPNQVKDAFNEVNKAEQEKEKLINQARSAYNQVIPKARGEAQQTIQEAKGYALERVNKARGDAANFNAVYRAYLKAPEVTRQRIYLETLGKILPRVGKKVIMDENASNVLPLLQLQEGGKK